MGVDLVLMASAKLNVAQVTWRNEPTPRLNAGLCGPLARLYIQAFIKDVRSGSKTSTAHPFKIYYMAVD